MLHRGCMDFHYYIDGLSEISQESCARNVIFYNVKKVEL